MKHFSLSLTLLIATLCTFTACEPEDPEIPNEEELITTLNYTLTPADGGSAVVFSFMDLDGDGGTAPVITGGTLSANQTYTGSLDLLNEAASPAESITEEILEEDEEHQFFFETDLNDVSISYTDQDTDGNPIGIGSSLTTGTAASGSIKIILRHRPNKSGIGVPEGEIANAGGETDIEVTFPVDVQ